MIGIDLNAALQMAAVQSLDIGVVSELLPAAEAGMVEAMTLAKDDPRAL